MGQQDLRRRNRSGISSRSPRAVKSYSSVCGSSWFDVRVFYLRLVSCFVEDAPDLLTMWFPTRGIDIALEINGGRIAPSEEACIALRRDRLDLESEEVTYVSTDNLRTSGSLSLEIYDRREFLVSGSLKQSVIQQQPQQQQGSSDQKTMLSNDPSFGGSPSSSSMGVRKRLGWRMECGCEAGTSKCSFVRVRNEHLFGRHGGDCRSTCMEVCVVGKYMGSPVILTQTVQLSARRSRLRCAVLDAIPEDEECNNNKSDQDSQQSGELFSNAAEDPSSAGAAAVRSAGEEDEEDDDQLRKQLYEVSYGDDVGEGEDCEVPWFNAGVRVGVGIGLGMCLGVGIGVGLLVRTYNATARSLRRGGVL